MRPPRCRTTPATCCPDKPKVEQTNLNSVINEIEKTTAQSLTKSPNATREQALLNDVADSGRPQPALAGTELATSTTIKRPGSFQRTAGRQRRAADRSRARL